MTFEHLYIVNVEAAICRGDRWLLIERSAAESHAAGTLALVGGKVEGRGAGAQILEATARREIAEEVGLAIDGPLHYLESAMFVSDDGFPVVDIVFACEAEAGDARPLIPAEVAAVEWLTAAEAEADRRTPPWTWRSLARAERWRQERQTDGR